MIELKAANSAEARIVMTTAPSVVSALAEYCYFGLVCLGLLGEVWGITIPFVLSAGLLGLALYSIWRLKKNKISFQPIALPVGCAISFIIIQVVIYNASLLDDGLRVFVVWVLTLIIVRSLCLRERFFHRFALVTFTIGILLVPFLDLDYVTSQGRAGLDRSIGVANPNDLAAWFGFCCVYCVILAIETRRNVVRIISSLLGAGCLFVVGLTVSRATLVAVALASTIGSRRILKRGFVPILLVLTFASVGAMSGVFNQAIGLYEERGAEETGRFLVWPLAFERFMESPVLGVGISKGATYVPAMGKEITPHNSFLYIGLTSGLVPFGFFAAYWIVAARRAYRLNDQGRSEAPFQLPLLFYTFVVASFSAGAFMFPWAVVTLSMAMSAGGPRRVPRLFATRMVQTGSPGLATLARRDTAAE